MQDKWGLVAYVHSLTGHRHSVKWSVGGNIQSRTPELCPRANDLMQSLKEGTYPTR